MKNLILIFSIFFLLHIIAAEETQITILHTNDCHGHVLPFDVPNQQQVGGMSPRLTYIKKVRQEIKDKNSNLLILDAGDFNTGDPFSDMLKGEPGIKAMNMMGYDAMVVGNHEFDLELEDLKKQEEWAEFPYISANVIYKDTGKHVFSPYLIVQKGDLRIGIIGITTDDTPMISTHGHDERLVFLSHEEALPKMIKELRPKVDFLIGLFHVAHETVITLAKKFEGLDMVVGGHTHIVTPEPIIIGKTIIVEAGSYGLLMGRFDLNFTDKVLTSWKHQNVAMNLTSPIFNRKSDEIACYPYKEKIATDPGLDSFLEPYREKVDALLDEALGEATANMSKGNGGYKPRSSSLGNIISDALRDYVKADIAMHNAGGIRADLVKGKITYRDVRYILPFANTIYIYTINGEELLDILKFVALTDPSVGRYFEVSGIEFNVIDNKPENIKVQGKPLNPEKVYKLATNSFIARGGDSFTIFDELPNKIDTGFYLADAFSAYIKKKKILRPNKKTRFVWK